jgi:hypothetical protein
VAADLDHVLAQWARVGIGVDVAPHPTTPDLERLILQTAECAAQMPRLFILAATWLHGFGELVAKHRLRGLVRRELHAHQGPVLGLLLSISQDGTHPPRFASVLRDLHAEPAPQPLFDIERSNPLLAARASCARVTNAAQSNVGSAVMTRRSPAVRQVPVRSMCCHAR